MKKPVTIESHSESAILTEHVSYGFLLNNGLLYLAYGYGGCGAIFLRENEKTEANRGITEKLPGGMAVC